MIALFVQRKWLSLFVIGGAILTPLVILLVLVYRERELLSNYAWQLNGWALLAAYLLLNVGMLLAAASWADMMAVLGSRVVWRNHIYYYVLSQLMKRLPGTVWYVAGRGYFYKQEGESTLLVTIASSLELAIICISGVLIGGVCLLYSSITLTGWQWVALVGIVVLGLGVARPGFIAWLLRLFGQPPVPTLHYGHIIRWLSIYSVIWLLGGVILFLFTYAVTTTHLSALFYIIGSWCLIGVLSVTVLLLPSNLGFTEIGLSLLLSALVPAPLALAIAIMSRVLLLMYELISAGLIIGTLRCLGYRIPITLPSNSISSTERVFPR